MKNSYSLSCLLALTIILTSCNTGVRDLDLINQQFQVTYNTDSTRGIDSTHLASLQNAKAIYTFSEDGKGTSHVLTGMLSKDEPFTWSMKKDTLLINQAAYHIKKEGQRIVLRSDSVKIMLNLQP
jgi:hypothetical protein